MGDQHTADLPTASRMQDTSRSTLGQTAAGSEIAGSELAISDALGGGPASSRCAWHLLILCGVLTRRPDRIDALPWMPAAGPSAGPSSTDTSPLAAPVRLCQTAEPSRLLPSTDDTINDRPPGIFHWVEDARESGMRAVRTANGPALKGAVFVAREAIMGSGREIRVEASNRLNLRDTANANQAAVAILRGAFETCLSRFGGAIVMLDNRGRDRRRGWLQRHFGDCGKHPEGRRWLHRRAWAGRATDRAACRFAIAGGRSRFSPRLGLKPPRSRLDSQVRLPLRPLPRATPAHSLPPAGPRGPEHPALSVSSPASRSPSLSPRAVSSAELAGTSLSAQAVFAEG